MSDDVDRTNDRNELTLAAYISRIRNRAQVGLTPNGACYNCSEDVPQGRSFCSSECREDYDYRARLKNNKGE